jgi:hypothetical protein
VLDPLILASLDRGLLVGLELALGDLRAF